MHMLISSSPWPCHAITIWRTGDENVFKVSYSFLYTFQKCGGPSWLSEKAATTHKKVPLLPWWSWMMKSFCQKPHSFENWSPWVTISQEHCNIRGGIKRKSQSLRHSKAPKQEGSASIHFTAISRKSGWKTHSQESSVRDQVASRDEKNIS